MKYIRIFSVIIIFLVMANLCLAKGNDIVKYNWAKSGLNIRISEGVEADVIGVIPFGAEVIVLEETDRGLSIKLSEVFSKDYSEASSSYYISGNWVQIRYKDIDGYVFDGYLSELPPMKLIKANDGNSYVEKFEPYLRRLYTVIDSNVVKDINEDLRHKEIRFENGVIYERNGNVGWYEEIIILPRTGIETGFLIFQLGHDTAQTKTVEEDAKIRIMKQNSKELIFWTGGPDEEFEIYQFGHTLVIRISNSC